MARGQYSAEGEIVREYLKRYKSESTRRVTAFLMAEYPELFKGFESTRNLVRWHRGQKANNGGYKASDIIDFNIPAADEEEYKPHVIDTEFSPMVVSSDWHIPYHDADALEIMLDHAVSIEAKSLLFNGDIIDFYGLSRFQKDPRKRSAVEEIEMAKATISGIKMALPGVKIIFKEGNHEERYTLYLQGQAPDLWGLDDLRLENVLRLPEMGVDFITHRRVMTFDKLHIIHGHEYIGGISAPVNPARGLYLRAKKSAIQGHNHQTSEHCEPSIDGSVVTCWSIGALCQLHPLYAPLNKWNHGFAVVNYDDGFMVDNKRIVNYRIM